MKIHFLLAFLVLLLATANAQNAGKIWGNILQNARPAEGATVSLLRAKDSATIKLSVVNKEGTFAFENIADGKYLVAVTAIGQQKTFSKPFILDQQQRAVHLPAITLVPVPKSLTDVTVTAKRSLVEQKIDRTVVNVDASITNIGTSALEVLEKAPGVTVDNEGNISLKGKQGVLVMVDDRPTQLSGADLANLLRNLNSSQLDQIEIMTNPPARYDAAGTSGVINIKTKKIITAGYNGSATLTYSQGRYPKTAEGFNFNYRNGKVNLFSNLSHNYRKGFSVLTIQRNIYDPNTAALTNFFDQRADLDMEANSFNAKVGADFFASKKTTFGIVFNGTSSSMSQGNQNITNISNASKNLQSATRATVDNATDLKNVSTNFNFRTQLAKGRELTSDIDVLSYGAKSNQYMVNAFTDAAGNAFRKADTLMGDLPQDINVYSGRVDYIHPQKKGARFEAGIKSSIVKTDNNAVYDSIQYGNIVHDFNRSNHFVYEENINAAYVNLSTTFAKKWSAQLGLRLENTNAKGTQLTTGEKFDRHYTQLF
ncbi:MAG: TonB-dependent receptor, partial [Chitinophagaceae bacterium]